MRTLPLSQTNIICEGLHLGNLKLPFSGTDAFSGTVFQKAESFPSIVSPPHNSMFSTSRAIIKCALLTFSSLMIFCCLQKSSLL